MVLLTNGIFSAVAAGTYSVTVKIQQDVYQMQHLLDNQCAASYPVEPPQLH
jgi:hypothetical protein